MTWELLTESSRGSKIPARQVVLDMMKHLSTGPVFYDPCHDQKRRTYNGDNHYARAQVQYRNSLYYGSYGVPGMAQAAQMYAPLTNTYYDAPCDIQRLPNVNVPRKARQEAELVQQRPQPTGGVALEVDYELEEMAEFVGIHACMLYVEFFHEIHLTCQCKAGASAQSRFS